MICLYEVGHTPRYKDFHLYLVLFHYFELTYCISPSYFSRVEEHNGIFEDLHACHLSARVVELLSAYAKHPPTGSTSETTKQHQLALALCKILSQATEGKSNIWFTFPLTYICCFRCDSERNAWWRWACWIPVRHLVVFKQARFHFAYLCG